MEDIKIIILQDEINFLKEELESKEKYRKSAVNSLTEYVKKYRKLKNEFEELKAGMEAIWLKLPS